MSKMGIALIGTGDIAKGYIKDLLTYPDLEVMGVVDMNTERAQQFGTEHGVPVFQDVESVLDDPGVALIVNLTSHHAHKQVTEQALRAGKHVYSEKPLALTSSDAWELVTLANQQNVRLACSPFSVIGEAQQTLWKWVREGKLGKVRVVYAEMNWGRIETWHPAPIPFYEVGAFFDVGVYPLAVLTSIFGPVKWVQSYGTVVLPDRMTKDGVPYTITTPDWMVSIMEMSDGTQVRLTTGFYVANKSSRQQGIEVHGDLGSLHLDSTGVFNTTVTHIPFGGEPEKVEHIRDPYPGIPWGRGVHEVATAIRDDCPHLFSGEQAAHIVDVLSAHNESMSTNQRVAVTSTFDPPVPAAWAL
jgi:predicted dehydrogenase